MRSRHECYVRDFDDLSFFDVLLVFLTEDPFVFTENVKWVERPDLRLPRVLERGDPLVFIVLKVAVGQVPVVFRRFFVNCFLTEVFRLGLGKISEEYFENDTVRFCGSSIGCDGELTIIKVRDCFQDEAVGIERLWPTDSTGRVSVGV